MAVNCGKLLLGFVGGEFSTVSQPLNILLGLLLSRETMDHLEKSCWMLICFTAYRKVERWQEDYNCSRPHESLGNVPPVEYKKSVSLELLKTGKLQLRMARI